MSNRSRVIALIPARGGSKGIPGKNLRRVGGRSLLARAILACKRVPQIDDVVVSTDDFAIAEEARLSGATVIDRPASLAGDSATSESALLHAIEELERQGAGAPDAIAFVQATSPFVDHVALGNAVELVSRGAVDVAFSVVRTHAFVWRLSDQGPVGVNHDPATRSRRQDLAPEFRETGAFYVLATKGFVESRHRFFGKIRMVEVAPATAMEIDETHELDFASAIAAQLDPPTRSVSAAALVMDFDGVHTDDRAWVGEDGQEIVAVSRSDGMGIAALRARRLPLLILSKERNPVVAARARKLGVEVMHAVDDKLSALRAWCEERGIHLRDVCYVGNDVNDVECMEAVGWPVAVADARPEVRSVARVILRNEGGKGALRELADSML